jgi:ATP-independent RNA helicase DbpA
VERVPSEGLEASPKKLIRKATMLTLLISGGRKDKLRPGDILGALTGDAGGISGDNVGKIEIQDRLSYVAVARGAAPLAVERLNEGRIKGKRYRATLVS